MPKIYLHNFNKCFYFYFDFCQNKFHFVSSLDEPDAANLERLNFCHELRKDSF